MICLSYFLDMAPEDDVINSSLLMKLAISMDLKEKRILPSNRSYRHARRSSIKVDILLFVLFGEASARIQRESDAILPPQERHRSQFFCDE